MKDTKIKKPPVTGVTIPLSIDHSCKADVTQPILAWIAQIADGSSFSFVRNGCYRVEGTLMLENRRNLTIDGADATFRMTTIGTRDRKLWQIRTSDHITIRNLTIIGPNTAGVYRADLEAQHGVGMGRSTNVTISHINVRTVYGDGVAIEKGSQNVRVLDSSFKTIGRQGISVTWAKNVLLYGNTFSGVARSVFDLEPNTVTNVIDGVTIEKNHVGSYRNYFVASHGTGCGVRNIVVRGNDSDGGSMTFRTGDYVDCHKSHITIEDNTFRMAVGTNSGAWVVFRKIDDVTVRNNHVVLTGFKNGGVPGVGFRESGGSLMVANNDFSGACSAYIAEDSSPVTAYNNETKSCSS